MSLGTVKINQPSTAVIIASASRSVAAITLKALAIVSSRRLRRSAYSTNRLKDNHRDQVRRLPLVLSEKRHQRRLGVE
jgi:hypothetical protein